MTWFVFIVLFCAGYYYYMHKMLAARKAKAEQYLSEHPDAAKVYLQNGMKGLTHEATTVISVNDEPPQLFYEKMKQGVLLLPGTNILEVTYAWNKPGILRKNVTTTYEASKQEVEVEPGKNYRLGFDRDAESYTFEELPAPA